jgi:N-acetylmuramoyl-L-alanine amidase/Putative peptidoglycan binding domain
MARFNCAVWRPIGTNMGGRISPNLGLILHHAVANGSLWSFFNNPASQVSAHFWVSQKGVIEQYVDTDIVAWHGRSLNSRYVGVETEGCTTSPYAEPMSDAMINGLAQIYKEGHDRHGWQFTLANSDGQPGFGFHRMAVNTACPCDVRLEKRSQILTLASGKPPTPTPQPPPSGNVPAWPGRYLTLTNPMMQGADIEQWQAQMAHRGWTIGVDGYYGPQSEGVCISFQSEKGLNIDGVVGPETWSASWTAPIT